MEPRTHYQISFTPRQAMSLFVGLLVALGLAYFFGLRTGLAGREAESLADVGGIAVPNAAASEGTNTTGTSGGDHLVFPAPVTGVAPHVSAVPTAPAVIRPFEDGEGGAPARAPVAVATPRPPASGGFRVQVVSVSSRADADALARRLTRSGFAAHVEPGRSASGAVYRVRVGPFATREEAAGAASRLAAEGRRETWIVPPGQ
ncbi:MAG: SPOR domain-containing protein [Acidobacteriota bacterium]|nr:SPOR domain-containing protein [Acidobacteriota bacterium]MDQ5871248.1 SPOR domain-containing protein [Acidobacteriota bacterium]